MFDLNNGKSINNFTFNHEVKKAKEQVKDTFSEQTSILNETEAPKGHGFKESVGSVKNIIKILEKRNTTQPVLQFKYKPVFTVPPKTPDTRFNSIETI